MAGILKVGRMSIQNHTYIDCYLGPDRGRFIPIRVQSIHRQRSRIRHIQAGQAATCAISFTGTGDASTTPPADFRIRKGQVISPSLPPHAFWEFEAEIHVLYHSSALTVGYQGVVYCGNVRQGAQVVHISPGSPRISPVLSPTHAPDLFLSQSPSPSTPTPRRSTSPVPSPFSLCTGQSGTIKLRFVYEPEWLTVGSTLLFRGEGRMKCVGKVASLSADVTPLPRAR